MKFQPFIAVPLSLLVAACSSSKFNSLMEARRAAWEWEAQGDQITIGWIERKRNTEYDTVTLTEEEYEVEREKNNKAAYEYAKDLHAKRDAYAGKSFPRPLDKSTDRWRRVRYGTLTYFHFPCKETKQIVCVTKEKIAGRLPPKTKQVPRAVWVDVSKELTFPQRNCSLEEETKQFVCWSVSGQQFDVKDEKEAKALRASIQEKEKYRYFRY